MSGSQQLFMESVSAQTQTKSVGLELGTVRYEGTKEYQYIYNSGGGAMTATYGCVLSGTGSYSACVTSTSSLAIGFGHVENAISATAYGWVLKRGIATFEAEAAHSFAVGNGLVIGTNGVYGNATAISGQSSDIGIINICGIALEAVASGASGLAYFRFL